MYVFLVCENSLGSNKSSYFHIHISHICERKYVKIDYAEKGWQKLSFWKRSIQGPWSAFLSARIYLLVPCLTCIELPW